MSWLLFKDDRGKDLIEIKNFRVKFLKPVVDVDTFAEDLFQATLRELSFAMIKIPLNKDLNFDIDGVSVLNIRKDSYDINVDQTMLSGKEWEVLFEYIRLIQRKLIG